MMSGFSKLVMQGLGEIAFHIRYGWCFFGRGCRDMNRVGQGSESAAA